MTGAAPVLTVRQPYASRIVQGTKRIENRTRAIQTRGLILIHAGAAVHDRFRGRPMSHLPMGAVIGAVQLVGSHNADTCRISQRCADIGGEYPLAGDPPVHHWELSDPIAFDDSDVVPAKGKLGLWRLETPSDEHLVSIALEAARRAR